MLSLVHKPTSATVLIVDLSDELFNGLTGTVKQHVFAHYYVDIQRDIAARRQCTVALAYSLTVNKCMAL